MIPINARPASSQEQSVIKRALEAAGGDDEIARFAGQVSRLRIVAKCECGCASVKFAGTTNLVSNANSAARAGIPRGHVVADALAKTSSGNTVGVMVWATDDELTGLEVYSMSAPDDASLPTADSVKRW